MDCGEHRWEHVQQQQLAALQCNARPLELCWCCGGATQRPASATLPPPRTRCPMPWRHLPHHPTDSSAPATAPPCRCTPSISTPGWA